MSTSSSKKEKRRRVSGETNKSFVKNVTSRMSGLLPATITKWFSSPSSSNTNGSAQVADATDSSTEDEAPETPVNLQPPAKRMRYTSPGNFNQFVQVETKCTSTNTEALDDKNYVVHQPVESGNFRAEKYLASSRLPLNSTVDTTIQDSFFKSENILSPVGYLDKKRKSIFDNTDATIMKPNPTPSNLRNPYFKPSLLSSPFYVGRTMYGGAASSYMSQPNVKQRNISLTNETNNNSSVTISHSARRVMDLLENYSSPLVEAKRIPPAARNQDRSPYNSPQKPVNPYGPKTFSYKTQELYVPTVASILTIKRKSRLMDTTNAARQIMASHSSTSEFQPYPKTNSERNSAKEGDKLTMKVKSKLTRANRKQNIETESDVTDNINLPNVVLQIDKDNLPKFTFTPLPPSPSSSSSSKQTAQTIITPDYDKTTPKTNETNNDKSTKDNDKDLYKFSTPVTISNESAKTSLTLPKFCFGSPERNIDKVQEEKQTNIKIDTDTSSKTLTEKSLFTMKSTDWKCLDCWVQNKIDVHNCVCCGGKKPIEIEDNPKKCSSCSIILSQSENTKCDECTKKSNNVGTPFEKVKEIKVSKWKCNDCWVDNDESAEKCVCCGGKNSKNTRPSTVNTEKIVESDWKCNECWIKNKSTLEKCAACCTPKLSSGLNISSLTKGNNVHTEVKSSKSTFENIAKSQREKWECPLCLVRNESNRATCICCEADRPGTIKESHKKMFNFHQPSEITFKFGIELKKQEEAKKQENVENANLVEKSETNNNTLPKTPTFNFGLSKKIEEQPEILTQKSEGAPKINFTFGIPKSDSATPIFGISNKIPVTPNTAVEKLQEVPQVFTSPEPERSLKTPVGLFNTPGSQNTLEIPATAPIQSSSNQATSKESSFFNTPAITIANSDIKKQQSSFTFSSITPAANLFATTTASATVASSIPEPLSSNTSGPSTLSLFQKPDVIKTTTVSFFQKSDAVATTSAISLFSKVEATTSPAPLGVTQPIFSFGTSAALPQPEKPKFQFNFGNNKTDSSTLFKPTFGVTTDNSISTNKFNIPSNTIASGNGISSNPLNNTTHVNPTNALTTGNSLTNTPAPSLFGTAAVQKENMWGANNNNMLFVSNTNTNTAQKPPTFTFGAATPFNATNSTFGSTTQPAQNVFGIPTTASQPMFGNQMNNQINSPMNNQTTPNIFGSSQPTNNSMPMGMFGSPNAGATPAFGTPNASMPTFEAKSLPPAPTPTFNFGSQQPPGIFGFGQPQQTQAPQIEGQAPQPGMYNFAAPGGAPQQLQFNMGSAPNTGRRVIRKAMRRTQR